MRWFKVSVLTSVLGRWCDENVGGRRKGKRFVNFWTCEVEVALKSGCGTVELSNCNCDSAVGDDVNSVALE